MNFTEDVPATKIAGGTTTAGTQSSRKPFRPEVQGLRALAVLMVVSYHIWFGRVSGGVDIFLLISSFLLTLSFVRKVETGKPLELITYWLHLFKRLLPAVVVVLLGTLLAVKLFVPKTRAPEILSQTWSSLLYFQNWVLANSSVDYYAGDHSAASPLQHFWSLSVQGQVFILWPILFALSALVARAARKRFRVVLLVVFGVVFLSSLGFSIYETYTNQSYAYFDLKARLWEFAFGTLLALALPYIKLPKTVRVVAGWVGLVTMLSVGFVLDVQGQFPGFVALVPLLAAAFIIVAGQTGSKFGVDRFLSMKPLTKMGDMSYALYLWHWPVLVIFMIWQNRESMGPKGGLAIILFSLLLAYLTTRFVEKPIRSLSWLEAKKRRAAIVIIVCLGLVAVPVSIWQNANVQEKIRVAEETKIATAKNEEAASKSEVMPTTAPNPGALSMNPALLVTAEPDAPIIPALASIKDEFVAADAKCTGADIPSSELIKDACGTFGDSATATKRIVIVGNSHSQQWSAPFSKVVKDNGWLAVSILKGGCQFADPAVSKNAADCNTWNKEVFDYIMETKPDAVFTVGTASVPGDGQDTLITGFAEYANKITEAKIKVIAMRDNPRFNFNMIECLETNGNDSPKCNLPRDESLNNTPPVDKLKESVPGIYYLDMTDQFCNAAECPGVIGNTYVYMDTNHVTHAYMNSLAPIFKKRFNDLKVFE